MTAPVTLLSGQQIGPDRALHLSPADATGEAWHLVDPAAPRGVVGLLRISAQRVPDRPRRAWGYRPAPNLPAGWEVVATGQGAGALGQALSGLLRKIVAP